MPSPRTHYADKYPVVSFLETAMEAKMESCRLRRKADRISGRIAQLPQDIGDDISREVRDILCQELTWIQTDIQRCADRYNAVKELIDKLPREDDRIIMRCYYLDGLRGAAMAVKVHEKYGVYSAPSYIEHKVPPALELLQSIYEMEVLCV